MIQSCSATHVARLCSKKIENKSVISMRSPTIGISKLNLDIMGSCGCQPSLKFGAPMNHHDGCYFCMISLAGFNKKNRKKTSYSFIPSAIRLVPHFEDFPASVFKGFADRLAQKLEYEEVTGSDSNPGFGIASQSDNNFDCFESANEPKLLNQ